MGYLSPPQAQGRGGRVPGQRRQPVPRPRAHVPADADDDHDGAAAAGAGGAGRALEEARNTPFCPSQGKFHTVVLRGVRNISETRKIPL